MLANVSERELEAFVQIVVLVAYADGELSEIEEKILRDRVMELSDDRVTDEHLQELMIELPPLSRSSENWRQIRFRTLKNDLQDQELRKEAFVLAVAVARSDGRIGFREGRMLVNMLHELELDGQFVRQVMENAAQKNT